MRGMLTSHKTRPMSFAARIFSRPSRPSTASETSYPAGRRAWRTCWRTVSESSTTSTLGITMAFDGFRPTLKGSFLAPEESLQEVVGVARLSSVDRERLRAGAELIGANVADGARQLRHDPDQHRRRDGARSAA